MVGGDYLAARRPGAGARGPAGDDRPPEGPMVELNFAQVMMKRLTLTGSTLRPQSVEAKARIAADLAPRGLAAAGGGPDRAGDRPHLPARGGRRGARPARELGAYRQDRARGGLSAHQAVGGPAGRRGPRRGGAGSPGVTVAPSARRVERMEAGGEDLQRRPLRPGLPGAAHHEEHHVVAPAARRRCGRRGRAPAGRRSSRPALFARLALGGLAAGLAGVDRAAGQMQAGQVGMPDQEHPVRGRRAPAAAPRG